jgi:hypothetical protein
MIAPALPAMDKNVRPAGLSEVFAVTRFSAQIVWNRWFMGFFEKARRPGTGLAIVLFQIFS